MCSLTILLYIPSFDGLHGIWSSRPDQVWLSVLDGLEPIPVLYVA